jgi:hypothetical protein
LEQPVSSAAKNVAMISGVKFFVKREARLLFKV